MSRFSIGDRVLIASSIFTRYRNRQATVVGVDPITFHRPGTTSLDIYAVRFDDGEQVQFHDTQLLPLANTEHKT